jgi:hypothetical protein
VVYPQYLELFPNWKGKSLETLKGEAHFISILTKVTVKLMGIIEVSGDADKLTAACKDLAAMPQHKIRKMQEFKVGFLAEHHMGRAWDSFLIAMAL